jgi:uncharacterized protein involved in outer membrane biogenesis
MKRALLWVLAPVAILVALAVAAPFLVPVSSFLPEITRIASEKIGQPVTIAELSFHLLPTPRVVAKGIVVGKKSDVRVGEVEIVPELLPLLAGEKKVGSLRAENIELKESALAIPGAIPKSEGGQAVAVRHVVLRHVVLHHAKYQIPPFDLDMHLGGVLLLEQALLEAKDTALHINLAPQGDKTAQVGVDGKLYGGTVKADARAQWTKLWQVSGKAHLAGVDVVPVQRLLGKKPQISGRLKSDATFSARAAKPEQLADVLALDGPFELLGGAYQGVDLTKAADITGKSGVGDSTPFQEFKGQLQMRGKRVHITELCVRSPKVVAGGNVEIAPDQALSGKLDVSIAKTGGFVGVPVALGGTTSSPSIRPTKGYIIGAAVGTLLLPGIGTGIGASAGSHLEGTSGCK